MRRLTVAGALLFSIAVLFQALASSVRVERKFFFDYIPSARESAQIYFGGPQLLVKWTPVMGTSLFTELGGDETAVGEIPPPEATGVICVSLYEDANGTGVWEPGEALLPEGRFSLVNLDTDKTLASYVTDGSNEPYCFPRLATGTFRVISAAPVGYTPTTRVDWDLTLAAGITENLEFGAQAPEATGTICVKMYADANGNGVLESGETLVSGGTLILKNDDGETLDSYVTDGFSEPHCFEDLAAGTFRVITEAPDGYFPTALSEWQWTFDWKRESTRNLDFGVKSTSEKTPNRYWDQVCWDNAESQHAMTRCSNRQLQMAEAALTRLLDELSASLQVEIWEEIQSAQPIWRESIEVDCEPQGGDNDETDNGRSVMICRLDHVVDRIDVLKRYLCGTSMAGSCEAFVQFSSCEEDTIGTESTFEPASFMTGTGDNKYGGVIHASGMTADLRFLTSIDPISPFGELVESRLAIGSIESEKCGQKVAPPLVHSGLGVSEGIIHALVQIVELDGVNDTPEVLFSEYSGGAHCCASVTVFSQNNAGNWQTIEVGNFDGGPVGAVTIQGSDGYVIQTYDNRFYYHFDCYACSRAPLRIFAIESGQAVDVSGRSAFVPLFREHARLMEEEISDSELDASPTKRGNGFWAGYVATKARAGEFDEAWEMMLANYEQGNSLGLERCTSSWDENGNCRTPLLRFESFPEALEAFLKETGYINPDGVLSTPKPSTIVKVTTANLRSGPDTAYTVVAQLEYGTELTILERAAPYPACEEAAPSNLSKGQKAVVYWGGPEGVMLRSEPSVPEDDNANIVTVLYQGDTVTVFDGPECSHGGYWWYVTTDFGRLGWVREAVGEDILVGPPLPTSYPTCEEAAPSNLSKGQKAVVYWGERVGANLRSEPRVPQDYNANVVALLHQGEILAVIDGPECAHGGYWWYVKTDFGDLGWVAEAIGEDILVTPLTDNSAWFRVVVDDTNEGGWISSTVIHIDFLPETIPIAQSTRLPLDEDEEEDTGTVTAAPEATSAICVTLYSDANGNGVLDAGEQLVAEGIFSLVNLDNGEAIDSYVTDGSSEPYCFLGLASHTFRVISAAPVGHTPTTRVDWDLTLAVGSTANLEFGAQLTGD